MAIAFLAAL